MQIRYILWQRCWTTDYIAESTSFSEIVAQIKDAMDEDGETNPTVVSVITDDGREIIHDHLKLDIATLAANYDPIAAKALILDLNLLYETQKKIDDEIYK